MTDKGQFQYLNGFKGLKEGTYLYKTNFAYIDKYTDVNKNATLIITDFLAMVYKKEQPHSAYLCRGWAKL